MSKLLRVVFISIAIISIGKLLLDRAFFIGDQETRERLLVETVWYLQEKGYEKKDIEDIEAAVDFKAFTPGTPMVIVRFEDEPDRTYSFKWDEKTKSAYADDYYDGKHSQQLRP